MKKILKKILITSSFLFVISLQITSASSYSWDLNNAGEYSISDDTKVEIADGVGKLIGTPGHYPVNTDLTITPSNPLVFTSSIATFTETLGANDVEGVRYYLLSTDNGTTWKCWDHGMWEEEAMCTGGSIASDINDNIATLDTDGGQFLWKATLKSWPPSGDTTGDEFIGENQVELDQVDITYDLPVNIAPVISSNGGGDTAAVSINENTTAVTTVIATDDPTQTITYSIVNGMAPEDSFFVIDAVSGVLTFRGAPDFENPLDKTIDHAMLDNGTNTYEVEVKVEDDQSPKLADTQFITVTILDVDPEAPNQAPTDITLDSNNINENNNLDDIIGNFTTTDTDSGSFTYTLVDNINFPDNSDFRIDHDRLTAGISFDYETKNTYTIKIQTDDGTGGIFVKEFNIQINDVNESSGTSRRHKKVCRDENALNYKEVGVHDAAKCVFQIGVEPAIAEEKEIENIKEDKEEIFLFRNYTFEVKENTKDVAIIGEEIPKTIEIDSGNDFWGKVTIPNPDYLPNIKAYDIDHIGLDLENVNYKILASEGGAFDGDKFEIKDKKIVFKTAPDFEEPTNFFKNTNPNQYKVALELYKYLGWGRTEKIAT